PLACSGCHSSPPAAPHPQVSNCTLCHATDRGQHVDGIVEVAVPATCDGCHGSATNPAPPRSLDGGPDVGAHQTHVVGRGTSRPVPCGECHLVPATVRASGHLDGVTQVRFSGVALTNLAMPTYAQGTCTNTACHDVSNWTGGAPGGGATTSPTWSGGQTTC